MYNVISAFSWSGIYIYIYIYIYIILLNTLSGGKSWLLAPAVAGLLWATETMWSPLVGGWWGQGIAHAFTCMMKIYIYIYIYIYILYSYSDCCQRWF